MEQEGTDVNEASSSPAAEPVGWNDGLVSTVDLQIPDSGADASEQTLNSEGQKAATPEEAGVAGEVETGSKHEESVPYDRFQEVVHRGREREAAFDAKIAALDKEISGMKAQPQGDQKDFLDVSELDSDKIRDMWDDDPKGMYGNLARQIRAEIMGEVKGHLTSEQKSYEKETAISRERKTLETYVDENRTSFTKLWNTGEIQAFVDQNPGHNYISAHQLLTAAENAATIKKTAQEETLAKLRAKQGAGSMSATPQKSTGKREYDDQMRNPDKYGGPDAVLARRDAMRMARSG